MSLQRTVLLLLSRVQVAGPPDCFSHYQVGAEWSICASQHCHTLITALIALVDVCMTALIDVQDKANKLNVDLRSSNHDCDLAFNSLAIASKRE